MKQNENISFLDFLELVVKRKRFFIVFFTISIIITYLSVFFFVDKKYDSSSTILPANEQSLPGIASMLGDLSGLPLGLGGFSSTEMTMFNTIIYSRSSLEKVISKFDLIDVYELDRADPKYLERALERLTDEITTKETDDNAYQIKIRSVTPDLAADINNYIIDLLNIRILELRQKSSKENRLFLAKRVEEVETKLMLAEDSLKVFQEKTHFYEVSTQMTIIIQSYAEFDKELIKKEIEKLTYEKILSNDSPQLKNIEFSYKELDQKLSELKSKGMENSFFLPVDSLPNLAMNYLRLFREIEINGTLLKYILPLYEQAKIEEKKDLDVIQVIDYAVPPIEKSYPPRLILTLLINFLMFLIVLTFVAISYKMHENDKKRIRNLVHNLFKW